MQFFRELNPIEEAEFRKHARENYKPFTAINGVWHPIYQLECVQINKEASGFVKEESK
jgi:hypothetical protein